MQQVRRILARAFESARISLRAAWRLFESTNGDPIAVATTSASEELLAAPLPELIHELGLAVAGANEKLQATPNSDLVYTIDRAEIELRIAISVSRESKGEIKGGGQISVFNVNASYSRTYGFKEEASSVIKLSFACKPRNGNPT